MPPPAPIRLVAAAAIVVLALSGCAQSPADPRPGSSPSTVATSLPGPPDSYRLYLHCGVRYAVFDGDTWEAVEPIPYIPTSVVGTDGIARSRSEIAGGMVRLSPTEARFTSTEEPKGVVIRFIRMTATMPLCA